MRLSPRDLDENHGLSFQPVCADNDLERLTEELAALYTADVRRRMPLVNKEEGIVSDSMPEPSEYRRDRFGNYIN